MIKVSSAPGEPFSMTIDYKGYSVILVGLQENGSKLAGVITGKALYEKCLDLRELIAITEDPEHVELEHD